MIIANEYYMLNAVGVPDAGVAKLRRDFRVPSAIDIAPIIANIIAGSVHDFGATAEEIAQISTRCFRDKYFMSEC